MKKTDDLASFIFNSLEIYLSQKYILLEASLEKLNVTFLLKLLNYIVQNNARIGRKHTIYFILSCLHSRSRLRKIFFISMIVIVKRVSSARENKQQIGT